MRPTCCRLAKPAREFALVAALLGATGASGDTFTWTGAVSGDWGSAANWDAAPAFVAGNEFVFHAPGAGNPTTCLGSAARTVGGLTFTGDADGDVIVRTYSVSTATGGVNRILTFDNGGSPPFITVDADATGDISVAPGGGRTTIKRDLLISHYGSGVLTYHSNNWLDDEGNGLHVIKDGGGTLAFGASGWKFGGGLVIKDGRVKILRDDAFGTGSLTMTGGGLSAVGGAQRTFTNRFSLAGSLVMGDETDNGTLLFAAGANGTWASNVVLDVRSGVIFQETVTDANHGYSLTKLGSGALALTATNFYAGGTAIQAGRIRCGSDASLGSGVLTMTGGALSSNSGNARTLTNAYALSGSVALGHATDNGAVKLTGSGTLAGHTVLDAQSSVTLSAALGQGGGDWSLTKTGPATLQLSLNEANTFAGGLSVLEGVVIVNNSEIRLGTGPVTLDGGTLRYIGTTVHATINRDLAVGEAGGAIELNTSDRVITWAGALSGSGTLTKHGSGPFVLAGACSHTGGLVAAEGELWLERAHPGTAALAVLGGATFGGSGSAAGACVVSAGGTLSPAAEAVGAFSLGGLSLQEDAVYRWQLDGGTNDAVAVTGDLSLPERFTLDVGQLGPGPLHGRVLFTYAGRYTGPRQARLDMAGDAADIPCLTLHDASGKRVVLVRADSGSVLKVR